MSRALIALVMCGISFLGLFLFFGDERNRILVTGQRDLSESKPLLGVSLQMPEAEATQLLRSQGFRQSGGDDIRRWVARCGREPLTDARRPLLFGDIKGWRKGYACLLIEDGRVVSMDASFSAISVP